MFDIDRRKVVQGLAASTFVLATRPSFAQSTTPQKGGTLVVGLTRNDSKTFDPMLSINPDERAILYCLYNNLTSIQPDLTLAPELAESWSIENGGTRYVFKLREGVKFQDGTPFDAEAVKWNIETRLDEKTGSNQRNQLGPVIASIEVEGPHVVVFNLNYPYPALLADMGDRAGFMVSPTAHAKFGQDYGQNPVGTGPFKLKEWRQGTRVVLERNPDYWLPERPYLDVVDIITVPNTAVGIQRMNIGEIDYMDRIGPTDLRLADTSRGLYTVRMPEGRWYGLGWQVDTEPFKNHKLRQAISQGIDRERMNQIILGGEGRIANAFTPPGYWYSNEPKVTLQFDPERAKQLVAESGYPVDQPLTLVVPSSVAYSRISELVAEDLQKIGLKINLQPVPQSEHWSRVVKRELNWGPVSWTVRPDPDTLYYYLLHPEGAANTSGYNNPEAARLLEQARETTDFEERRKLYGQVDELMMTDLPFIMLYFTADYAVLNGKVGGFVPIPDQYPRFREFWKNGEA